MRECEKANYAFLVYVGSKKGRNRPLAMYSKKARRRQFNKIARSARNKWKCFLMSGKKSVWEDRVIEKDFPTSTGWFSIHIDNSESK